MRTIAAGVAVVAAGAAAPAAPATADDRGLGRYYEQRLEWHACALGADDTAGHALDAADARCADVTVPLDYADPDGRTLTVAISRIAGDDRAHHIGALLLNGGGPGGPGLDMPPGIVEDLGEVAGRFDVIGMDPRFVGRSTPLDCGWTTGSFIRSPGLDRAAFRDHVAHQRDLADRCRAAHDDVLPHITTRNTARDMDVIRGALGERRLSYLGYSYGTYLGEVYTQLFPGRTDRMVLDGVLHPSRYQARLLRPAAAASEAALRGWAEWTAARDATYGLGTTAERILATVADIERAAAEEPLAVGPHLLDEHLVAPLILSGLGSDLDPAHAALAETTRVLAAAARRQPAEPGPGLAADLEFLLTGEGSPYGSVQAAILCGDVAGREGVGTYWRDAQRARAAHPFAGAAVNGVTPCEFWDRPAEEPTVLDNDVPALLVSATGDPRTVHAGAEEMRAEWPASRLLTLQGAVQHGVYGEYGNACVDDRVNAYLSTGRLPADDPVCAA
jgi:pimeloyl-ACP methyl ester carboxylesterase